MHSLCPAHLILLHLNTRSSTHNEAAHCRTSPGLQSHCHTISSTHNEAAPCRTSSPVYSPIAILSAVHIMKPLTVELPPVYISAVPTNPLYLPHYPNLNTFTLRSSRSLKGPYKTTGNVVILHILMHFQFL